MNLSTLATYHDRQKAKSGFIMQSETKVSSVITSVKLHTSCGQQLA